MKYTLEEIKQVLKGKNYIFFETINIIGIRSNQIVANSFDDWLYLIFKDENDEHHIYEFQITTDPGAYWLKYPSNVNGTAILVPGQYINSHVLGYHQGRYEALKQQGPLKVWRDNSQDLTLDKSGEIYEGVFGINIHRSNATSESSIVEKWSAGTQVFKKAADFDFFMNICKKSNQEAFTYTLLEETDF